MFAILIEKDIDGVRHLRLDTIISKESDAIAYVNAMNDNCGVRVHYTYQPVNLAQKYIDADIILRIENIANCLHLADVEFMKRTTKSFEASSFWYLQAITRSKVAAQLLHVCPSA